MAQSGASSAAAAGTPLKLIGPTVYVGNRKVFGEDVHRVACRGYGVVLDPAVREKMAASEQTSGEGFTVEDGRPGRRVLSKEAARAALLGTAIHLMQARTGVRVAVVDAVAEMLNRSSAGVAASEAMELPPLLVCDTGLAIAAALQSRVPGGLQAHELDALTAGVGAAAGIATLAAHGTRMLVSTADVIAACTSEVLRVSQDAFMPNFASARPHPGIAASSNALRYLVDGSTQCPRGPASVAAMAAAGVTTSSSDTSPAADAGAGAGAGGGAGAAASGSSDASKFHSAQATSSTVEATVSTPQFHGPALDAAVAGYHLMTKELNASPAPIPTSEGFTPPYNAQPLLSAIQQVQIGVHLLARASLSRHPDGTASLGWMSDPCLVSVPSAAASKASSSLQASVLYEAVEYTHKILVNEFLWSQKHMSELADQWKKEAEEREAKRKANAPAPKAMTEKQKRKAAQKAAKKAAKGSASSGQSFGKGVKEIHARLSALSAVELSADTFPFSAAGAEFHVYIRELLERLASGGERRLPRLPLGTKDNLPEQMEVRQECFSIIRNIFRRHGAVEIDTPVFELKETLTGKYGEEGGGLIYDLADQGELLSMRYDLTVPFARYLAMNQPGNIKRFHMARVYRRDKVIMKKGRFREFYQCDFDIAGQYTGGMMADAEVLTVACEVLAALDIGEFQIKFNHRKLLDAVLSLCGVPDSKFRTICSAIDKLDKQPWEEVKDEMVNEKGLSEESADKIGEFVAIAGEPREVLSKLREFPELVSHRLLDTTLEDLARLFDFLESMDTLQYISFDLALARGLDYYTGVIYEGVVMDPEAGVGSIAAGGRYDNLVGIFSGQQVPCVGVSIGLERVLILREAQARRRAGGLKVTPVQVLVAAAGKGYNFALIQERMRLLRQLWNGGYSAETMFVDSPNFKKQLEYALDHEIPFMVTVGEAELEAGIVQIKDTVRENKYDVPRDELLSALAKEFASLGLATPATGGAAAGAGGSASGTGAMASAPAAPSTPSSAAVVVEGNDRRAGKFSRPKTPIA